MSRLPIFFQRIAVAVSLSMAWAFASSQDIVTIEPGSEIAGALKFGRNTVKLPSGSWRLLAKSLSTTTINIGVVPGVPRASAYLGITAESVLTAGMTISGTLSSNMGIDRWLAEPCKVAPTLYLDDSGSSFTHPECLYIRVIGGHLRGGKTEPFAGAEKWAKDTGTRVSATMLLVYYAKYSGQDYLLVGAYLPPSTLGMTEANLRQLKEAPADVLSWAKALKAAASGSVGSWSGMINLPDMPRSKAQ